MGSTASAAAPHSLCGGTEAGEVGARRGGPHPAHATDLRQLHMAFLAEQVLARRMSASGKALKVRKNAWSRAETLMPRASVSASFSVWPRSWAKWISAATPARRGISLGITPRARSSASQSVSCMHMALATPADEDCLWAPAGEPLTANKSRDANSANKRPREVSCSARYCRASSHCARSERRCTSASLAEATALFLSGLAPGRCLAACWLARVLPSPSRPPLSPPPPRARLRPRTARARTTNASSPRNGRREASRGVGQEAAWTALRAALRTGALGGGVLVRELRAAL